MTNANGSDLSRGAAKAIIEGYLKKIRALRRQDFELALKLVEEAFPLARACSSSYPQGLCDLTIEHGAIYFFRVIMSAPLLVVMKR
jgi:hypothetical protein